MPFSFPPLNRRQFLQGSLAGAAGMVFARNLFGEEDAASEISPDAWALISDTHIPADTKVRGEDPATKPYDNFVKARIDILSGEAGKPCGVILSGDCAMGSGYPADYRTIFKGFRPVRESGLSVHYLMGNHDNRQSFVETMAEAQGKEKPEEWDIPKKLCSVLEAGRVNFFLLDSLTVTNHSSGHVGDKQIAWLEKELDKRKDKPAILVAHHYPDYTRGLIRNPHALQDTEELYEKVKDRKQVKAFIFGHSHFWMHLEKDGIHLVNLPTTAWVYDAAQPRGWVFADFFDDGMKLILRSIDPAHPKHNETLKLAWR